MTECIDFADELARLAQRVTGIDRDAGTKLAAEVRKRFGGRKHLILRPQVSPEHVDAMLKKGMKVPQIARECGVCRKTIYRRIGERRKCLSPGV